MSSSVPADKTVQQGCTVLNNERNIDSIRALEEQIKEHETAIIKLKRARNSLLNVSRLPSEILGDIFRQNVTIETDFGELKLRSHNFLSVCHHWFEVASHTPELWSFWGSTLGDWKNRHLQYPNAPLDLTLGSGGGSLDDSVRDALQDRAARDIVRRIHISAVRRGLLESILAPLSNPLLGGIRSSSVESIILVDHSEDTSTDVSNFFACYRFPKLRRLRLDDCMVSSWDILVAALQASVLTTLNLCTRHHHPTITTPQLLSILGSNPALQKMSLLGSAVPDDNGDQSSFRVPLRNLRELRVMGGQRQVLELLHRLDLPDKMGRLDICLDGCTAENITTSIGPYLRDSLRRRGRSQNGLGLELSNDHGSCIEIDIVDVGGNDLSAPFSGPVIMGIMLWFDQQPLPATTLDLIAHIPQEEVVHLRATRDPVPMGYMSERFPYLRALHLQDSALDAVFSESGTEGSKTIFPSLQHITLRESPHDDWSPLTAFLTRRASYGNRLDTLEIDDCCSMDLEVEKEIMEMVREFRRG